MRILLVKTSSLGDVIHNLPVASDIARCYPDATIDWCVESPFVALPRLHPAVGKIIPVSIRSWRHRLFSASTWQEIGAFRRDMKSAPYDLILDTQGLVKSAVLASTAIGPRHGYDSSSAREPLASYFYQVTHAVPRFPHAVTRNRQLTALALGYSERLSQLPLDYGIVAPAFEHADIPANYAVLLTATSRADKLWPDAYWIELGQQLAGKGITALLPSGTPEELSRAQRISAAIPGAVALPRQGLLPLASILARAHLVIGVDTGLTHLAAALRCPVAALYTTTDPQLTGVLSAEAFENLGGNGKIPSTPVVWDACCRLLPRLKD